MIVYKYRDLSNPSLTEIERILTCIRECKFWCASPTKLNDPEEFLLTYDIYKNKVEENLLIRLMVAQRGHDFTTAKNLIRNAIKNDLIEGYANSILEDISRNCRNSLGLCCFSMLSNDAQLWDTYGGMGNGIVIGVELPNSLKESEIHAVNYVSKKSLPLSLFLSSYFNKVDEDEVYIRTLCTKTIKWQYEREMRFVSRRQNVLVQFKNAKIKSLRFGSKTPKDLIDLIINKIEKVDIEIIQNNLV